jgi:hypothetical protein
VSLEIRSQGGIHRVYKDGVEIRNLQVVVAEFDTHMAAELQMEMRPAGEEITLNLLDGTITWVVGCPNCPHNSVHTCDVQQAADARAAEQANEGLAIDRGPESIVPVPVIDPH